MQFLLRFYPYKPRRSVNIKLRYATSLMHKFC